MALFLVCFLASTVAPEQTLPALGFSGYDDLTIRLYGIFQLSWALLFYFAQKNPEKNLAIIHSAIVTGSLVAALLLFYPLTGRRADGYLWLNAAILLVYTALLFIFKPRPARP